MYKLFFSKLVISSKPKERLLQLKFTGEGEENLTNPLRKSGHTKAVNLITQALNIYAYLMDNADIFEWVLEESGENDIIRLIHTALEHYRTFHLDVNAGRRKRFTFICPEPIVSQIKHPDE